MSAHSSSSNFVGGRLSLDFVNELSTTQEFTWEELTQFLQHSKIITQDRCLQLQALPEYDPHAAAALLRKARRFHIGFRHILGALLGGEPIRAEWVEPMNELLKITEGHDELLPQDGGWRLSFVARENSLEWLLAAVARSAAELVAESPTPHLRLCSNPSCGLFFYDTSRTHARRWCSMSRCGNRNKVAAFSRRHTAAKHAH